MSSISTQKKSINSQGKYMQRVAMMRCSRKCIINRSDVYISYLIFTSGTPEVCLLPTGMADKNKLVLHHPLN